MTLASDGCGAFAYRVSIDGCPSNGVTLVEMVAAGSAGVAARVNGLNLQGLELTAEANPIACTLNVGGLQIKFADGDNVSAGTWSGTFDREPSNTTWLTRDCNAAETSIEVASTAGFASAGYVWIDSECFAYTSKGAHPISGNPAFLGCTRGALSDDADAATYHYIENGARLRSPEVTDWPVLWENRRVRVYRYQETDDLAGAGTQVYLGMIDTAPRFDGVTWSIGVRSIASILGQTLGADLSDSAYPRGIYYPPETPCTILVRESGGATLSGFTSAVVATAYVTGKFETQEDYCTEANTQLVSVMGSITNNSLRCVSDGPTGYHFEYTTLAGGSARMIMLGRSGGRDGAVLSPIDSSFGGAWGAPQDINGVEVTTVAGGTKYYFWPSQSGFASSGGSPTFSERTGIPGAGTVPRGIMAVTNATPIIYLGGSAPISTLVDSIQIEWQPTSEGAETISDTYELGSYDTGDRSITLSTLDYALGISPSAQRIWTSASMPAIRFGLTLSDFGGLPKGSFGFMQTMSNNQQQFSTLGVVPMLRDGDWDAVGWAAAASTGQPQFVTRRYYTTFSPVSIAEIITEELKLARCFLAIDSTGRLVPRRIRLPAASELSTASTIDQATLLTDEILLSHEVSGLGQVNEVVIKTGYDPNEDKFLGRTVKVRDVAAYGQSPSVRSVSIAPKSQYLGPPITDDEAVQVAAGIFGTFAGNYATDTLDVAMHDDVELGDVVVFDNPHYPNGSGAIGVTGKVGLVIGRKTGTYSPRCRLTVLTTRQKLGGYAPAADVTGATDSGGDVWKLNLDDALFPPGTDVTDWFVDGDRVRVIEANTASSTVVVGTASPDSATSIIVQFDGVWGGPASGTAFWYLTIADSDDASLAATQRRFCHIADTAGVINYAADSAPAFRFGA